MPERAITPHQPIDRILTGLFNVQRGYSTYRPDGTRDYLLFLTLSGCGRFMGGSGKDVRCGAGELVLLPPATLHDYATDERTGHWRFYWAHFEPPPGWLDLLDWPKVRDEIRAIRIEPIEQRRAAAKQFEAIHRYAVSRSPLRTRLAMNGLEHLLLRCAGEQTAAQHEPIDARLAAAMDYIFHHLAEPLPVATLAEVAGLSVSRFSHLFRASAGCSAVQFIERARLDRATELLRMTSLSVKEIANQVGFAGPFYFSLRFKRRAGMSPSAYRDALVHR